MFSSGSQLLCLQQRTRSGESRGRTPPRPLRHRGLPPGPPGPGTDRGMPVPGAGTAGGRAGERGRGREIGKGRPRRRGARRAPRIPGELRFQQSGRGAATAGGVRRLRGGRTGPGRGSGAPRGGGEGPAAAALICKQKERHDPNKSGRAGGTRAPLRSRSAPHGPAIRAAPHRAPHRPHRPAHLEDQPRHLTRYSSLPCGERRERGVSGGGGAGGAGRGAAGPTLRSRLLRMHSAAKTCSPTLLSSSMAPAPRTPPRTRTQGEPPGAPPTAAARAATPPDPRAPPGTIRRRGGRGVPKFPAGQWGAGGGAIRRGGWGEALSVCDPSSSSRAGAAAARPERGQWGGPARGFVCPGGAGASPAGPAGGSPRPGPARGSCSESPARGPSWAQSAPGLGQPAPVPAGPRRAEQAAAAPARFSPKIVDYNRIKAFQGGGPVVM